MEAEKKDVSEVTVDDILKMMGPFGRFNVLIFFLILLPVGMAGMYSSVYNFEAIDIDYRCAVPECQEDPSTLNFTIPQGLDGTFAKCTRYASVNATNGTFCGPQHFDLTSPVECDSYVYMEEHSIVNEFDLACQDWKRSLVGTIHNAGFFIAIPLTGLLSDKYGRRTAVIFSAVSNGVFGLIRAFSVNYDMFIVFEFLEPAFGAGVYTACFVLALELVGPKGRVFVSLMFNTMFILGGVLVTVLSWYLRNWRQLLVFIYTPAVFCFVYIWLLSESFRWLFSRGRYDEALRVLKRSEKFNNVTIPQEYYDQIEKQAINQREERKYDNKQAEQSSLKQLLVSPMIWKRTFICSVVWISSTLVYYGLSINAIELSGNSYLNYIVVILVEAPANVCKLVLLDRFGRKKVIASAYFLTALVLVNYGFVPAGTWSHAIYLGGKFFITLAYNSLYVFAAEVFPTNYRTSMLALCSTIGRIGSTCAPLTPLLKSIHQFLPTLLFGAMAAMSGFLILFLPETLNTKLPDSLKEAQAQDNNTAETPAPSSENKTRL
ncbi:organic cation transporter protein [Plutella xylostella]|uniref:organic cation transporter protein n=1 Tax=Plutella xylostella TaxID=51655 RepID=UPI002032EC28|nr:organic cation transporter protein [Plutella xylostella]